jgi:hypothetical protein
MILHELINQFDVIMAQRRFLSTDDLQCLEKSQSLLAGFLSRRPSLFHAL